MTDAQVDKRLWDPGKHSRGPHGRFSASFDSLGGEEHHARPVAELKGDDYAFTLGGKRLHAAHLGPSAISDDEVKKNAQEFMDRRPDLFTKGTHVGEHVGNNGQHRLVKSGTALALAASLAGFFGDTAKDTFGDRLEAPDSGPSASEMYNHFHNLDDKDDIFHLRSETYNSAPPFDDVPSITSAPADILSIPGAQKAVTAHTVIGHVNGNVIVRLNKDWADMEQPEKDAVLDAIVPNNNQGPAEKSTETPELSDTHRPLGTHGLWGDKTAQLPAYIQNIAHAMLRDGHDESSAIQLAVGAVKRWAAGEGKVTPEVQAAATKALAEWDKLKAEHSKTKVVGSDPKA